VLDYKTLPAGMSTLGYFPNFFHPYPANPINPEPKRSMVAGSGTAFGVPLIKEILSISIP